MKIPALTVIDDFYDDPSKVVEIAQTLKFEKTKISNYPGSRTEDISKIAPVVYEEWFGKFKELFQRYHPAGEEGQWIIATSFQRIPVSEDPRLNHGWVHSDVAATIAGVIYLNDEITSSRGTSLMKPKPGTIPDPNANLEYRNAYYGGRNEVDSESFIRAMQKHNDRFTADLTVSNKYNRMIAYLSATPHMQTSFGEPGNQYRLTQVFFADFFTKDHPKYANRLQPHPIFGDH